MAAWQSRPVHGNYENREEYHFRDAAQQHALKLAALSDIEAILATEADFRAFLPVNAAHHGFSHNYKEGIEARELQLMSSVLEVPPDGVLYVKDDRQFMQKVVGYQAITETLISSESYHQQHLKNSTEVTVQTTINQQFPPLRSHYVFEQYEPGTIWATFSSNDTAQTGESEHEMTPFDYRELKEILAVVHSLRTALHQKEQVEV